MREKGVTQVKGKKQHFVVGYSKKLKNSGVYMKGLCDKLQEECAKVESVYHD